MPKYNNLNDDEKENLNEFWISIKTWIEQPDILEEYFIPEYTYYDSSNWYGGYSLSIDYDKEYRIFYGKNYPDILRKEKDINIQEVSDFIEIMYKRWIKPEKHYKFTVETNNRFEKFKLPYQLSYGDIISKGYKTTEAVKIILNYEMFEKKISYSEEMIMESGISEKKSALDCIVDALQYYISIQKGEKTKDRYKAAARRVCSDQNSKVYKVINDEIDKVMELSNAYFDIRHNEYFNDAKEKREPLSDSQFIEYLYNRVYGLLYLLRLKTRKCEPLSEDNNFDNGNI